jgi:hypothetical protein
MVGIFLMFKRERDRIKIDENKGKKKSMKTESTESIRVKPCRPG